jgi:hypothetical protein
MSAACVCLFIFVWCIFNTIVFISMDFHVLDQFLIIHSVFIRYQILEEKWEYSGTIY